MMKSKLPIAVLASLTVFSTTIGLMNGEMKLASAQTSASQAGTLVPVQQILATLKNRARVPILLPSRVSIAERVYFKSQVTETGYSVEFNGTPDCQGTPCYFGSLEAERGRQFITPEQGFTRTFKNVRLVRNIRGVFHNGCGAYCTATVEWQSQGVLYRVSLKNGQENTAIQIANSAIQAGRR